MSHIVSLRCTAHLGGQRAFCRRQGSPPITWVWRANSGRQVWQQTPFPTDLSFQPLFLSFETESCCIIHAGCELSLLIFLPSAETAHHAQHSLLVVPPSFLLPSPLLSYLIGKNAHGGGGGLDQPVREMAAITMRKKSMENGPLSSHRSLS